MVTLKSHGFKFSRPEANYFFDVSFFTNPWRDKSIRDEKNVVKRRNKILSNMRVQQECMDFVVATAMMIRSIHKLFPDDNMQIAFCCSAGEYRSPAIVELVSEQLKDLGVPYKIEHSKTSKL